MNNKIEQVHGHLFHSKKGKEMVDIGLMIWKVSGRSYHILRDMMKKVV